VASIVWRENAATVAACHVQNLSQNEEAMKDDDGGELTTIPNEKYRKFFAKFDEIETLNILEWRIPHVLGYFCQKYKETYGVDYSWKFNHQLPSKCFEVWQMNTLAAKLSANPKILKDYIDWAYQNIVPKAKRRLTSISFLTREEVVNDYKLNVLLAGQRNLNVDRSTSLPTIYQDILRQTASITISTYGELAFISQVEPLPDNIISSLDQMVEAGFDREVLKRIV
jgi:hypothetical protein